VLLWRRRAESVRERGRAEVGPEKWRLAARNDWIILCVDADNECVSITYVYCRLQTANSGTCGLIHSWSSQCVILAGPNIPSSTFHPPRPPTSRLNFHHTLLVMSAVYSTTTHGDPASRDIDICLTSVSLGFYHMSTYFAFSTIRTD